MKNESAFHNQKCSLIGSGRRVCLDFAIRLDQSYYWLYNLKSEIRIRTTGWFLNQLKLLAMASSLVFAKASWSTNKVIQTPKMSISQILNLQPRAQNLS